VLPVHCCSEVDDGELWHSSAISKRIDSHVIETVSGSHYLLLGNLDVAHAKQNGRFFAVVLIFH